MSTELKPLVVPTVQEQIDLAEAWHRRLKNLSADLRKVSRARPRDDVLRKVVKLQRKCADQAYSACLNNLTQTDPVERARSHWNLRQSFRQS